MHHRHGFPRPAAQAGPQRGAAGELHYVHPRGDSPQVQDAVFGGAISPLIQTANVFFQALGPSLKAQQQNALTFFTFIFKYSRIHRQIQSNHDPCLVLKLILNQQSIYIDRFSQIFHRLSSMCFTVCLHLAQIHMN